MDQGKVMGKGRQISLVGMWAAIMGAFLFGMAHYDSIAGPSGRQSEWPKESRLKIRQGAFQLILFAHPHCPCTPATLSELAKAVASATRPTDIQIVLVGSGSPPSYWNSVLPTVQKTDVVRGYLLQDESEFESEVFGANTSGQIFLFDSDGGLRFKGGITDSRGHEGDNVGRSQLAKVMSGARGPRIETPVFGCPL